MVPIHARVSSFKEDEHVWMPICKPQSHTASFHSSLQRYCSSEMKQKPLAVFDFKEEDPKPFVDRCKAYFSGKRTPHGKQLKHGKGLDITSRKKRKISMKRPMKNTSQGNVTSLEASGNRSSCASDMIEAGDSDSESNQDRVHLDMRFGGAHGVQSLNVRKDEDQVAEQSRKVVIFGEELFFLEQGYSFPEFIFTADAIILKIQVNGLECVVKWPLHEIKSFRSYPDQEKRPAFIELDLTEHGVEALRQELGQSNSHYLCHTVFGSISNINSSWVEDIKQITSLSDGYKSIWEPGKEDMSEHFKRNACRQDLNYHGNQHLLVDCIVQDRNRASSEDWFDLIFPTKEDHDAVTVTRYDYLLLNPDQFLSDTIIDFYIKYLQSLLLEDDNQRFYFYNSFFFRKLTEMDKNFQHGLEKSKSSFDRVKRWTARINIFDKDYLFIPIMQSAHWSLVIVCHPGSLSAGCQDVCNSKLPMILHFDSLEGCHTCVEEPIRNYLKEAWNERNGQNDDFESLSALKFSAIKVPQQTNYSDCGLFLLHYVELFIKEVLEKDSFDFATDEWFNPADVSSKRAEIQSLIEILKAKDSAGNLEKSQQHAPSTVTGIPDGGWVAQRSVSFGNECLDAVIKETDFLPGNLYDQACMLVSHPQYHENNMEVCAYPKLGHDHLELRLDHEHSAVASGVQQCFCDGQRQAPCGELSGLCLLQQGADNHAQDISMHHCTCVEENCIVHGHDRVSLNDPLDCVIHSEDLADSHAQVRDVARNSPGKFAEGLCNDSTMAKENFNFANSDGFASNSVDVKFGFAFCFHYDDKRFSDMTTSSVQKFCLDEVPSTCGFQKWSELHSDRKHSTSDEADSLAEQAVKSNCELDEAVHGSNVSNAERKDWLIDPVNDTDDQLEGKETVSMNCEIVATQHNADDSCQAIDLECTSNKGANSQLFAAANKSLEGSFLQNEDDNSSPLEEEKAGFDRPHYISSDEGVTPFAPKSRKEGKRGRGIRTRNVQHASEHILAPANRPATRSTSKKQVSNMVVQY